MNKLAINDDEIKDSLKDIIDIDKLIHEPARLLIMSYLIITESADFIFLRSQINLTWGNLSSHIKKLEEVGYVKVIKKFIKKKPHSMVSITELGKKNYREYREKMKRFFQK